MKITIDKEEKQKLFDEIIKELSSNERNWRASFRSNPIHDAFKSEIKAQMKNIMHDLVNSEEFKEQLIEVGKKVVTEFLKRDIGEIISAIMEKRFYLG